MKNPTHYWLVEYKKDDTQFFVGPLHKTRAQARRAAGNGKRPHYHAVKVLITKV